ncbi:MAG: alpha/beta fold hydrolase [Bacteroidia bacterium]
MKAKICLGLIGVFLLNPFQSRSQDIDTLLDVGGYRLHFVIWEGEGTPILLESGGGNDASIWTSFANEIHAITNSPIITYDRAGYGQSEYDPSLADDQKSLIDYGVRELEKGITKLGFEQDIIFVGHSYGGFYAAYFAHKYPDRIKGMVLIDVNHVCYYTEEYVQCLKTERTDAWLNNIKSLSEPVYYECLSFYETIEHMRGIEISPMIPVIDLVAGDPPFDAENDARWHACHAAFVEGSPQREGIIAADCEHYLHFDNRSLAINAIIKIYCQVGEGIDYAAVLQRSLTYNLQSANQYREREYAYWHSERDFNGWGYRLLNEEAMESAIAVFALNATLYPESANAWDSYGEALLLVGQEEEAIKAYQKSLELNPDNQNAREVLAGLNKE